LLLRADDSQILATAWEPYQELFQGVITCLHSDFRIGGLAPGQKKTIRGKLYLTGREPVPWSSGTRTTSPNSAGPALHESGMAGDPLAMVR
jgi:hypothetical protein